MIATSKDVYAMFASKIDPLHIPVGYLSIPVATVGWIFQVLQGELDA
jgi:hypothetical protein